MIDQPTIDRIMDAAQIYDVVSDFVTLRKRGVNYVGLCPFHLQVLRLRQGRKSCTFHYAA